MENHSGHPMSPLRRSGLSKYNQLSSSCHGPNMVCLAAASCILTNIIKFLLPQFLNSEINVAVKVCVILSP